MKPYQLTLDDEIPVQSVPDVPHWSENYAFYGYDYDSRVGFAAFLGRWSKDTSLWREQIYLFLPDGSTLNHREYGRGDCSRGPNGGLLSFEFDAPGRWTLHYAGPARHATVKEFMTEPVLEGYQHRISVTIKGQSPWPVLMLPPSNNTTYGKWHYEQLFTFKGEVDFAGKRYPMDGHGYRDHTRGPRKLDALSGHLWLQLLFPEQRAFTAYHVWIEQDGKIQQVLDEALSISPGGFSEAKLIVSPQLHSVDDVFKPTSVEVQMEGRNYRLTGAPLATIVSSFTADFEFFYGCCPSIAQFSTFDQPVMFECEGQPIKGYVQRSLRLHKPK